MSRPIEFRAWHPSHNTMVYFDNEKASKDQYIAQQIMLLMADNHPEGSGLLMQYTGLTDKNGKKIFEGDILNYGYYSKSDSDEDDLSRPMNKVVKWEQASCSFIANGRLCFGQNFEVIGNIYTNPELLNANSNT